MSVNDLSDLIYQTWTENKDKSLKEMSDKNRNLILLFDFGYLRYWFGGKFLTQEAKPICIKINRELYNNNLGDYVTYFYNNLYHGPRDIYLQRFDYLKDNINIDSVWSEERYIY